MSNNSGTRVADVFGDSFAEKLEQSKERNWEITEALTTEYTTREESPPDGVSKNKQNRIKIGGVSGTIIRIAQLEYGLGTQSEAIKKLLRCGFQETYAEWGRDEFTTLMETEDAITHASLYLTEDISISTSAEEWKLNIESDEDSERSYILWYQDFHAEKLSETLEIPKSEVIQLAIIMAGRELAEDGVIPGPKAQKIRDRVAYVDRELNKRNSHLEQLALGAITTAWTPENRSSLSPKLKEDCPGVLETFNERMEQIQKYMETRK